MDDLRIIALEGHLYLGISINSSVTKRLIGKGAGGHPHYIIVKYGGKYDMNWSSERSFKIGSNKYYIAYMSNNNPAVKGFWVKNIEDVTCQIDNITLLDIEEVRNYLKTLT